MCILLLSGIRTAGKKNRQHTEIVFFYLQQRSAGNASKLVALYFFLTEINK